MSIKENDNQIYTKYYDDPITNYLRNIIQRYFEIEYDNSLEKRETLIIQAYTRLKEILNAEISDFIICINEKSGSISLSIQDLNGEPKIEKNTAFNKSFDSYTNKTVTLYNNETKTYNHYGNNIANRIVEGNDDRLVDARTPLNHVHEILEIENLEDFLNEHQINPNATHLHKNKHVLDLITYTGSQIKIDLVLLEELKNKVDQTVIMFGETDESVNNSYKKYINQLKDILLPVQNRLSKMQDKIDEWINFYNDSTLYSDKRVINYTNQISIFLNNYLTKKEFNILNKTISDAIKILDTGYINFSNTRFLLDKKESVIINQDINDYRVRTDGYTLIALKNNLQKKIPNNISSKIQDNNINNALCRVLFEYDKNGKHFCDELPQIYQVNDSKNSYIYIYSDTDSNNNINIYLKRLSYIPVYLYNSFIFYARVVDNENNIGNYNSICLENVDSNTKYTSISQDGNIIKNNNKLVEDFDEDITDLVNEKFQNPDVYCFNNKTYLFVINDTKKWKDAESLANSLQGHLAMPKTNSENNYLKNIYQTYLNNSTPITSLWLGATDMYEEEDWAWVDGTKITNNNWFDGEPDNMPSYKAHYMELKNDNGQIKWSDNINKTFNNYIVELDRKDITTGKVIFEAQSFKENENDKYDTKIRLTWSMSSLQTSYIKILRKYSYEYSWEEIYHSTQNDLSYEYIDTIKDTRKPNIPELSGKCIYKSDTQDKYEIKINYSDTDEFVEYKMQIFGNVDWTKTGEDFENNLVLRHETNGIIISSFSGIDHVDYLITQNAIQYDSSPYVNVSISKDDKSKRTQTLLVTVNKEAFPNKIIFCDTSHIFSAEDFNDYYKNYECHLLDTDNISTDYLNIISNPSDYDDQYHVLSDNQPTNNLGSNEYENIPNNSKETEPQAIKYFDGTDIITSYNTLCNAFGEFEFKAVTDFFSNPKFKYQLFLVPHKGE